MNEKNFFLPPLSLFYCEPLTRNQRSWMCHVQIKREGSRFREGGWSAGIQGRVMFTHSAANFTWHQLSEHILLHDLNPRKRKKEEGRPSPCGGNLLYSPFLSFVPPFILCLGFVGLLRSDVFVLFLLQKMKTNLSSVTWKVICCRPSKPLSGFWLQSELMYVEKKQRGGTHVFSAIYYLCIPWFQETILTTCWNDLDFKLRLLAGNDANSSTPEHETSCNHDDRSHGL